MADQEDDANKPPEVDAPDPNPEEVNSDAVVFLGKPLTDMEDLTGQAINIAAEKFEEDHGFDPRPKIAAAGKLDDPDLQALWSNMRVAAEEAAKAAENDEDAALKELGKALAGAGAINPEDVIPSSNLAVDEFGNLISNLPEEKEEDFKEHDAEMDAPANPEDPGGDRAAPDPDPLVDGTVIQMPSSKNGADAYWKLRDSASDAVGLFADDLKAALEDEAFGTEKSPYAPNYNGGDFLVGYDKNDKLVMYYIATVAGNFQTKLADLRDSIGATVVDVDYMGVASEAQVQLLLVPMYNEAAGGCGDVCGDTLPFELHPQDGLYKWGYHYNAPSSGGSWSDAERAGGAARNETFNIVNDATGISLGTCGFTIRMVEYVSTASSICLHRLLTFDKCGTLTGVSASIESELS
tara:strand:- start:8021 stop:9244 length:1224 start_codon:yes stop_codon:yes gene_type:complete